MLLCKNVIYTSVVVCGACMTPSHVQFCTPLHVFVPFLTLYVLLDHDTRNGYMYIQHMCSLIMILGMAICIYSICAP